MQRIHLVKKERPIGTTRKQQVNRTRADNPSKKTWACGNILEFNELILGRERVEETGTTSYDSHPPGNAEQNTEKRERNPPEE